MARNTKKAAPLSEAEQALIAQCRQAAAGGGGAPGHDLRLLVVKLADLVEAGSTDSKLFVVNPADASGE